MKYHELVVSSHRQRRRVGRGISAGRGKTAGRGTKGQKSRAGAHKRPGFEGGQNPLLQRLPKLRGFKSHHSTPEVVYTGQLQQLGASVTNESLASAGLVSSAFTSVKLLQKGELTKKVTVKLQAASAGAIKTIEKTGGTFSPISRKGRPKTQKSHKTD